jgi:hypothetical protein
VPAGPEFLGPEGIKAVNHALDEGFVRTRHRGLIIDDADPERLLERMARYVPPTEQPVLHPDQI